MKNRFWKKAVSFACIMAMAAGFTALPAAADDITIGISIWSSTDVLGSQCKKVVDQAAEALGVKTQWVDTGFVAEQVTVSVETLCAAGCDGIIICNSSDSEMTAAINTCNEYGVYFAQFFRMVAKENSPEVYKTLCDSEYFIGSVHEDEVTNGYTLVNILLERGDRNIGLEGWTVGDATFLERWAGYQKAVDEWNEKNPDDPVVLSEPVYANTSSEEGAAAAMSLYNSMENMDALIVAGGSGDPLIGSIGAFEQAGLTGEIDVVSTDFLDDLADQLEKGAIVAESGGHFCDPLFAFMMVYNAIQGKHFEITHAVNHVTLDFYEGEIRALIGENGSGKSTFTSMLTGIYTKDSGTFTLEGKKIEARNQIEANNNGVAIIVQEMGTLSGLTVAENIFLGKEDLFIKNGIKNTGAMNRKAQELLENYGFSNIKAANLIDNYTFEERKLIEIVKSTWFDPKVLVVDETTTALGHEGREELFKVMRRLRDQGSCVIFISHDLDEVLQQADTVSVLRDSVLIDTVNAADVTTDDPKKLMVGREMSDNYYRTDYGTKVSDEVVLRGKHLTVPGELDDFSIELHKGEILGIGGLSECGMHEVGKALFGASYNRKGSVCLKDDTPINSIPDAIRHSIAYASKDRDNESLVINDTIKDNICLPSLEDLKKFKVLRGKDMKAFALKHAQQMSIKMGGVNQFVSSLSGGNKQKVVLARWIGKDSDLIILDSPTRGIDVKVKADIYRMMDEMRRNGKSIIMISEEIMELLGMSDRIIIMKDGKANGEFLRDKKLTEDHLIQKMV